MKNEITHEQIGLLRTEAAQAGDFTQVELCERAWRGDTDALKACQEAINEAEAARGNR